MIGGFLLTLYLIFAATIIFACVIFNCISRKIGIPVLMAFIVLGMFFGSDGVLKIPFENYEFAERICSIALIFIMFYGGFGTKWSEARPIAIKAALLSSLGTTITAGLVGLFCFLVLRIDVLESFLIGAVISSTDAASVFSILRSKRLNLKNNTASLLEVESGSNDPFSYMLTVIILSLMGGDTSASSFVFMLLIQIICGVGFGIVFALLTRVIFKKFTFSDEGFDTIFILGIALISYAAPTYFGGNGYLSVYITGIILGNLRIPNKQALVHFFDGITGLMQMTLFFLLGLLAFPSQLPGVALTALGIALFLTFVARPIAVFAILSPFKCSVRQQLLVSWAGMRGAASIVFAILVVINPAITDNDIYHMVFFIVLFSILVQGTLIPFVARFLKMTDNDSDVMKTFNDYIDEEPVQFIQFTLSSTHAWVGKVVSEILLPPDTILILLVRGKEKIVPNGNTNLQTGDTLILSGLATYKVDAIHLYEKNIDKGDEWINKRISEVSRDDGLIVMIRREGQVIIPKGTTTILENDVIVINYANA